MTVQETLASMSNESLKVVWQSLMGYGLDTSGYDPDSYWSVKQGITMDDWAEAVQSEMEKRNIPKDKGQMK